jgi:hypothetical protein
VRHDCGFSCVIVGADLVRVSWKGGLSSTGFAGLDLGDGFSEISRSRVEFARVDFCVEWAAFA